MHKILVKDRGLHLECAKVLHAGLLMPVLLYGRETMISRENQRSRIKAVQIDILRGLLGLERMHGLESYAE